MNDYLAGALLGLIQGLTEFLPVSSSGHLVLAGSWLPGWQRPGILFEALLHLATLFSIFVYYRRELVALIAGFFRGNRSDVHFTMMLVVGSIPTAIIGLGFEDTFEQWFAEPVAVGGFLMGTAAILVWASRRWWYAGVAHVSIKDALLIGIFQGMAIAPGISRSGSTFAAGLWRGIDPALAARYSFFLSVPAILGATLLKLSDAQIASLPPVGVVLVAVVAAALSGILAIRIFVGTLVRGKFLHFAIYCFILGVIARTIG